MLSLDALPLMLGIAVLLPLFSFWLIFSILTLYSGFMKLRGMNPPRVITKPAPASGIMEPASMGRLSNAQEVPSAPRMERPVVL